MSTSSSPPSAFDIRSLLTASAFPHPVDHVVLKETHVSWIVLTGQFAYKIKKPVVFDFIDTRTLQQRQLLCNEELRLNRRLAADLYIDVVPIVASATGFRVGGSGRPIEYAVRMKQFAAADELGNLLASHRVSRTEIDGLATLLSDFHARAPSLRSNGGCPVTQRLLATVLENVHELTGAARPLAPVAQLETIARWLQARAERDRPCFEERERCGYIRECHGDLHAGNIVRYQGRLLPFDCLEFDSRLRWIDVMDDVTFLVMDLTSHDRHDLACELFARYLEHGGDYRGVQLFPFYAVHRALVRAKVDALSASQVPERSEEFRERLQRRLRTAQWWSGTHRPALILMHGTSGSGKSWLSDRLIPALPALRIRSDLERKRLAGVAANDSAAADVNAGIYSQEFTRRTYERLNEYAATCLQAGFTTIVDATFLDANERASFESLAESLTVPLLVVACASDRQVLERRICDRAAHGERISDADLSVLAAQLEAMKPFSTRELQRVIRVDTSTPSAVEDVVRTIRARLESMH